MNPPVLKHPGRWLWLLLLVPVALGLARLRFDVEVFDLLPNNLPAVEGLKLYQQYFANARELIVTVTAAEAEQAENTARSIAERLRAQTNQVASVTWEPPWFEHPEQAAELIAYLWFNQPPELFGQLTNRLAAPGLAVTLKAAREELATSMSPQEIARLSYDPFGLTRLPESASAAAPAFGQGQEMFSSQDGKFRLMFVQANHDLRTYRECDQWLKAIKPTVQGAVASAGQPPVQVGYTGRPAFEVETALGMEHDITTSVGGTAAIIALLFWLAHKRIKPMLWLLTLLALTLGSTLALGGLIYGKINVVSMGFAAILLGLAVDYAVVHYQEALAHPNLTIPQIRRAIAPSIFWAAVTTIAAFLALNFGGLPGLGQLGTLVGLGVALAACIMIFEFLPPLFPDRRERNNLASAQGAPLLRSGAAVPAVAAGVSPANLDAGETPVVAGGATDKVRPTGSADLQSAVSRICNPQAVRNAWARLTCGRLAEWNSAIRQIANLRYGLVNRPVVADGTPETTLHASLNPRRARTVFGVTMAGLLFTLAVLMFGRPPIDPTANALRPRNSPAYAALEKIQHLLNKEREPLWLIIRGQDESAVAHRLNELQALLTRAVSNHSITDFKLPAPLWPQPAFQAANRATAHRLAAEREVLRQAARMNGFAESSLGLTEGILDTWQTASTTSSVFWPSNQMSRWIFEKVAACTFTNCFALGLLNPAASAGLGIVESELPHGEVWLSGWELLGSAIFSRVKANMWKVLAPMLFLILLSLGLAFRRPAEIALSLAVLLFSGLCLLTVMRLAGWSWNLLNLMAIPLILGTGVDYSIFMQLALRRYQGDLSMAYRSVGRALLLCGGTAIAGFGSLSWSSNAGMASLGQVCAVGVGSNMLIAIFLLPVWWQKLVGMTYEKANS